MTESKIILCGHGSGFPSTKNMANYLESRYNQFASNGKRKGLVAVRRIKNFSAEDQKMFKAAYSTILGRNYYSQTYREYVFKSHNGYYYSDCSSSGDACYGKAGHDVGWLNTAGIYNSSKFESVPVIIKNGHVQNPEVLQVGDALLFVGNDPSRPLQIGHVEYIYQLPERGWHWVKAGNDWFYQDEDGRNSYGWKTIKETGGSLEHWYYFHSNGKMAKGVLHEGGRIYYLMENGDLEGACCRTDSSGAHYIWNVGEE